MALKKNKIPKRKLAPTKPVEEVQDVELPEEKSKRKLDIWNKMAIGVLTLFLVGCISVFFVLVNIINDPEGMRFSKDGLSTLSNSRIFDSNGTLVYEFGEEIREDVKYDQLPQTVIDSFLSIEDSRFFEHNGFDLPRFLSAAMANLQSGAFSQGGSTLTMQMIDNAFTTNQEKKLIEQKGSISKLEQVKLKIQEIYLALVAEQSISKESVFEYYVNRIWFGSGNNTRGIQKAAEYYFSKDVSELNLSEAAFLAGSVNAPNEYNPLGNLYDFENDHLEAGQKRRNVTLELMLNHGYITEEEFEMTRATKLSYRLKLLETKVAADPNEAYINQVIDEVIELTGQDPGIIPMDIYTCLNTEVQYQADQICKGNVIPFPDDYFDVGFAVIDNASGEIIAVGPGRTYHEQAVKIDNSTDRKQPGSSMKPVVAYSSTFDLLGWSTEATVPDIKKDYWHNGSYLNNSDGKFLGNVTLAYALGVSKNTCAAQAMEDLINVTGYDYWINFLRECGYDEDVCQNFNEQYSIGGANMWASPIQQASAYSMFANRGVRIDAHRVRSVIRRSDGEETARNAASHQILSSGAAFMTSFLLYKVVNGGYQNFNNKLMDDYPCYGKSGTSDWGSDGLQYGIPLAAIRDEWSVGYTSQFTVAVWSGYTAVGFTQGFYIPTAYVSSYTQAFDISNYLLDFCRQYGNYVEIPVPEDVTQYGNGYIRTESVNGPGGPNVYYEPEEEEEEEYYEPEEIPEEEEEEPGKEIEEEEEEEEPDKHSSTGAIRLPNFFNLFNFSYWFH
ncbi:MAG: transglycosylase domain-containing protein [Bacillota bacterium]|nr:transglycosylase domain-containing protein [Bacillota bacterium]